MGMFLPMKSNIEVQCVEQVRTDLIKAKAGAPRTLDYSSPFLPLCPPCDICNVHLG